MTIRRMRRLPFSRTVSSVREMADSGIDWVPVIPADWIVVRAKYILRKLDRRFEADDTPLVCTNKAEVVVRGEDGPGLVSSDEMNYQGVCEGDLLIHGMDTWHGAIAVSKLNGKCTTVVHVCDSNQDKRFLCYYYRALSFQGVYKLISNGIRQNTSDFRSFAKFGVIPTLVPPLDEQRLIADYLDERCGAIDEAKKIIEDEIESLRRLRKTTVFKAVTKGLDNNAPMQNSGIEWIGEIPANWQMAPNHAVFTECREVVGNRFDQYKLLSLTKQGVIERDMDGGGKFPSSFDTYQVVRPGQMVFCLFDIDETPRTVGLSSKNGMITGAYDVFDVKQSVCDSRYAFYYYLVVDEGKHLRPYYRSLRKTLTSTAFRHVKMLLPPLDEQRRIADYLDERCAAIDSVIDARTKQLERLEDYRRALIYAYVTGKKEVSAS